MFLRSLAYSKGVSDSILESVDNFLGDLPLIRLPSPNAEFGAAKLEIVQFGAIIGGSAGTGKYSAASSLEIRKYTQCQTAT